MFREMHEFFVFGCERHISDLITAIETTDNIEILDHGNLKENDEQYHRRCSLQIPDDDCVSESFVLLGLETHTDRQTSTKKVA